MVIPIIAALPIVLFVTSETRAAEKSWYTGAGASRSRITGKGFEMKENSPGYKAYLGYKFGKYDALEAAYISLGEVGAKDGTAFKGGTIQINWMFFIPVASKFRLSAGLGIHRWQTEMSNRKPSGNNEGVDLSYSFGFEYEPAQSLGFRVEHEIFKAGETRASQSGISIYTRF